jgi:hypothetical protein
MVIHKTRNHGRLQEIQVRRGVCLTHFLFVDDILLFGLGIIHRGSQNLKEILELYSVSTGM